MVPFKFILIVQNNSEIFKSISYRYKFLVGARDPLLDDLIELYNTIYAPYGHMIMTTTELIVLLMLILLLTRK